MSVGIVSSSPDRRMLWGRWSFTAGIDRRRPSWGFGVFHVRWLGITVLLVGRIAFTLTRPVRFPLDRETGGTV